MPTFYICIMYEPQSERDIQSLRYALVVVRLQPKPARRFTHVHKTDREYIKRASTCLFLFLSVSRSLPFLFTIYILAYRNRFSFHCICTDKQATDDGFLYWFCECICCVRACACRLTLNWNAMAMHSWRSTKPKSLWHLLYLSLSLPPIIFNWFIRSYNREWRIQYDFFLLLLLFIYSFTWALAWLKYCNELNAIHIHRYTHILREP